jgi:hypothetical protein
VRRSLSLEPICGRRSGCKKDPFGKGSKVRFSTDYLTDEGVKFAKSLFTDRIEALRCRE